MEGVETLRVTAARFGADAYVIALAGELDLHGSDRVEREIAGVFEHGAKRLIIDLTGVTFLGSVGLSLLTGAVKCAAAVGGACVVVSDDPRVLRVFEITGLHRIFQIERSLMEAVDELAGAKVSTA